MCSPGLLSIPRNGDLLGLWPFYKTDVIALDVTVGNLTAEETYTSFAQESQCSRCHFEVGKSASDHSSGATPRAVTLAGEKWQQPSGFNTTRESSTCYSVFVLYPVEVTFIVLYVPLSYVKNC